jgi:DNA-binding NtrC family response regulator
VRVVSATNRNLREAVARGQFREELYYRINVIAIELPPLRDRAGDIPLLAHAFLNRYGQSRVVRIADDAMTALEAYPWPGNVRELQNVIERACALADDDTVRRRDLADYVLEGGVLRAGSLAASAAPAATPGAGAGRTLQEAREQWMQSLESAYLRDLLDRHGGNVSAAAKAAGIDRKTFHRLASKHGIR